MEIPKSHAPDALWRDPERLLRLRDISLVMAGAAVGALLEVGPPAEGMNSAADYIIAGTLATSGAVAGICQLLKRQVQ
jgi:hypothetical protein